jgi:GPH family glycoside/pentoside/hexuronide:cation symporter
VFRNPSFRILFATLVIFFVAQGVAAVLALHAYQFFWKLPNGVIGAIGIVLPIGTLAGIPFISWLAKHVEKVTLDLGGLVVFCFCQLTLPLLKVLDLLPPNGPLLYGLLLANVALAGAAISALVIGFQSMMADAADEHELLFGARREGLYFAGLNFSVKAAGGAGVLIAGRALDLIRFPVGLAAHGGANAHIPVWTLKALGLLAGPGAALITAFGFIVLLGYKIDRKRHAEILAELTRRRQTPSAK